MSRNKLDQIKAAQLAEAEQTGENPYALEVVLTLDSVASVPTTTDFHSLQIALETDIAKIAATSDLLEKAKIKQAVLPTYLPFVEQYVKSGEVYPNEIAVYVMIWLFDVVDIEKALNLALVLIQQKQRMPSKFDRDMQTFVCDFMYDWAAACLKNDHSASPYLDVLVATLEKDAWDVHVLCLSKLLVMLAKFKELAGEYQTAWDLASKAETINPEKAGVKGLKDRLKRHLNKPEDSDPADSETAE